VSVWFDSPFVIPTAALAAALAVLKVTFVLLAATAVSWLMRRQSAAARHLVWLVALIATLVLPLWSAWSPLRVRVLPAAPPPVVHTTQAAATRAPEMASVPTTPRVERSAVTAAPASRPIGIGAILLGVWALGFLALLARLALGALVVRGIVRRAETLEEPDWQRPVYEIADRLGLERAPRLVQSDRIKMPFATGFLEAVIVLPAESDAWNAERRCAVLIHEFAHVRRRDLVGHLVGGVACALFWFHPLVWKAAWNLRAESERACDDLALVLGTPALDYAEHLLEIVSQAREEQLSAVALAMAKPREFEGRMLAILDPRRYRRAPGRVQTAWLIGSLTALALVVGAVSPARRVTASPSAPVATRAGSNAPPVADNEREPMPLAQSTHTTTKTRKSEQKSQIEQTTQYTYESQGDNSDADKDRNQEREKDRDQDVTTTGTKGAQRAEVLAKSLRTDSDADVRRVAAWGLERYAGNETAARALVDALAKDESKDVREMAAWALAESRSATTVTALGNAFLRDKSPDVKRTAAWAAGSIGSRASVQGLTGLLADADPAMREIAAWSIGSCSPDAAPRELIRALGDSNRDVRMSVAWALYAIADGSSADEIEAAFRREKDKDVQRALIRALGAMGERAIDTLTRLVDSPDPQIRAVAVAALAGGNLNGPWPWPRPEPRPFP
jgi:beta-lactamase regulating signal transducer with metallopeptidase domain